MRCIFEVSLTFSLHYAKSHLFFECSFSVFQFLLSYVETCPDIRFCSRPHVRILKWIVLKKNLKVLWLFEKSKTHKKNTFSTFQILFWIVQAWEDAFTDYYWKKLTFWNAIGGKLIRASLVRDFSSQGFRISVVLKRYPPHFLEWYETRSYGRSGCKTLRYLSRAENALSKYLFISSSASKLFKILSSEKILIR